jgi:Spy/CpxP family protein refolding chaperone
MKGLHLAMGKLTPEQRAELVELIRDYLSSKGITIPAEIKEQRDAIKKEIKDLRKQTREEIRDKRTDMRVKVKELREKKKEYTGHVSIMK